MKSIKDLARSKYPCSAALFGLNKLCETGFTLSKNLHAARFCTAEIICFKKSLNNSVACALMLQLETLNEGYRKNTHALNLAVMSLGI